MEIWSRMNISATCLIKLQAQNTKPLSNNTAPIFCWDERIRTPLKSKKMSQNSEKRCDKNDETGREEREENVHQARSHRETRNLSIVRQVEQQIGQPEKEIRFGGRLNIKKIPLCIP